jgi:hypothetical protein
VRRCSQLFTFTSSLRITHEFIHYSHSCAAPANEAVSFGALSAVVIVNQLVVLRRAYLVYPAVYPKSSHRQAEWKGSKPIGGLHLYVNMTLAFVMFVWSGQFATLLGGNQPSVGLSNNLSVIEDSVLGLVCISLYASMAVVSFFVVKPTLMLHRDKNIWKYLQCSTVVVIFVPTFVFIVLRTIYLENIYTLYLYILYSVVGWLQVFFCLWGYRVMNSTMGRYMPASKNSTGTTSSPLMRKPLEPAQTQNSAQGQKPRATLIDNAERTRQAVHRLMKWIICVTVYGVLITVYVIYRGATWNYSSDGSYLYETRENGFYVAKLAPAKWFTMVLWILFQVLSHIGSLEPKEQPLAARESSGRPRAPASVSTTTTASGPERPPVVAASIEDPRMLLLMQGTSRRDSGADRVLSFLPGRVSLGSLQDQRSPNGLVSASAVKSPSDAAPAVVSLESVVVAPVTDPDEIQPVVTTSTAAKAKSSPLLSADVLGPGLELVASAHPASTSHTSAQPLVRPQAPPPPEASPTAADGGLVSASVSGAPVAPVPGKPRREIPPSAQRTSLEAAGSRSPAAASAQSPKASSAGPRSSPGSPAAASQARKPSSSGSRGGPRL